MKAVDTFITGLALFAFPDGKLTLIELMSGASLDEAEKKRRPDLVNDQGTLVLLPSKKICRNLNYFAEQDIH